MKLEECGMKVVLGEIHHLGTGRTGGMQIDFAGGHLWRPLSVLSSLADGRLKHIETLGVISRAGQGWTF